MATIYSGTNDGHCGHGLGAWADVRRGAGNVYDSNDSRHANPVWHFYQSSRGTWGIYRAFFEFDTSGISIAPSAATLKIQGFAYGEGDIVAVKSTQGGTLAAGDFNSFHGSVLTAFGNTDGNGAGDLSGVSNFTYSAEITTWSASGYNDITLNATAIADMVTLDTFKVCLMNHDNDYKDQDGTTQERNGFYWAEDGGSNRPYIDYTAGVAVTDNSIFFGTNF